ncbi:hypothetical protein ALC53_01774 [Atta colombica]|uniref:Uncharacterized protein n=1 Tax=Atta colombica TaxID=520822 RepID=A0A151I5Y3_9HYME|nr:hypothetical protein ALC53_01774 [Atta colombica]
MGLLHLPSKFEFLNFLVAEAEKEEEKKEEEEEEESISTRGIQENPSYPLPLEYPKAISLLFNTLNKFNLGVYLLSALMRARGKRGE